MMSSSRAKPPITRWSREPPTLGIAIRAFPSPACLVAGDGLDRSHRGSSPRIISPRITPLLSCTRSWSAFSGKLIPKTFSCGITICARRGTSRATGFSLCCYCEAGGRRWRAPAAGIGVPRSSPGWRPPRWPRWTNGTRASCGRGQEASGMSRSIAWPGWDFCWPRISGCAARMEPN